MSRDLKVWEVLDEVAVVFVWRTDYLRRCVEDVM